MSMDRAPSSRIDPAGRLGRHEEMTPETATADMGRLA